MRNGRLIGILAIALLGTIGLQAQDARAALLYPEKGAKLDVYLVRAMDECTGPGVTIANPGGTEGCLQANSTTDDGVTAMKQAKLKLVRSKKGVKIRLNVDRISPAPINVGLQMTLRTSSTFGLPAGVKTYEDVTVVCGTFPGGPCGNFSAAATATNPTANIRYRQTLSECLAANGLSSTLAGGNIEVIDVGLINCSTGKIFAVPGLLQ